MTYPRVSCERVCTDLIQVVTSRHISHQNSNAILDELRTSKTTTISLLYANNNESLDQTDNEHFLRFHYCSNHECHRYMHSCIQCPLFSEKWRQMVFIPCIDRFSYQDTNESLLKLNYRDRKNGRKYHIVKVDKTDSIQIIHKRH